MQRYGSLYKLLSGFFLLLGMVSFAGLGFAQEKPAAGASAQTAYPYYMGVYHINQGTEAAFELLIKNEVVPALRKGGVKEYGVWKTATLGESNTYVEAAPLASLAELDNPHPLVKALGQKGAEALWAKFARFTSSYRAMLINIRADLSMAAQSGYVPKLALQVTTAISPGRTDVYEKNIKGVIEAIRKANAKGAWVAKTGLGGNPNEYRVLILFDSFTDMQKFTQPFIKALSEAKLEPPTGVVHYTEYAMFSYLPELSIQAPAQAGP